MPKPVETMSDHELLVELVREKRRADRERAVKTAVALAVLAVIVVLCVIYVPRIAQTVRQFQAVMDRLDQAASKMNEAADEMRQASAQVQQFFGGLGEESLRAWQQSVEDVNQLLEGLKNMFRFG